MSEPRDLPATADFGASPSPPWDLGAAEADKLQRAYRRRRLIYRRRHPDRGFELDERAVYLAPEHLRVRVGGGET